MSHGKTVCSCGELIMQCRCMEGHRNVTVIQKGCHKCRNGLTPAVVLAPAKTTSVPKVAL